MLGRELACEHTVFAGQHAMVQNLAQGEGRQSRRDAARGGGDFAGNVPALRQGLKSQMWRTYLQCPVIHPFCKFEAHYGRAPARRPRLRPRHTHPNHRHHYLEVRGSRAWRCVRGKELDFSRPYEQTQS